MFEVFSHIGIEFSENEYDLICLEKPCDIIENFLEYTSCSLAPTDDEEMCFIGFPRDSWIMGF
jgi:hypothetical protein